MAQEIDLRGPGAYVELSLGPDELPAGAVGKVGSKFDQALDVAKFVSDVFGARAGSAPELVPESEVTITGSGASSVTLVQQYRGIPVFRASQTVRFSPSGDVQATRLRWAAAKSFPERSVTVSSDEAVRIAARHAMTPAGSANVGGADGLPSAVLPEFEATAIASFTELQPMPSVYQAGPFAEPVRTNLLWFPLGAQVQLAWQIEIALANYEDVLRCIVSATDGRMLYLKSLSSAVDCQGRVFTSSPDQKRELIAFPVPWERHGVAVPVGVSPAPAPWVSSSSSEGPSAEAFDSDTLLGVSATSVEGVVTFDPVEDQGLDQLVLNGFYATCLMHDFMYLLGFQEKDGSFQLGGTSALGLPTQRVRVSVVPGPLGNTAQWVPVQKPVLRLGRKVSTGRHSALDLTVVLHEYTHGVCNRLVGSSGDVAPLTATQSRGMNEGWADYFASMATGKSVFGGWVSGDEDKGLRRFAYDTNFPVAQVNFDVIETMGIYEIGEMWCATLLDMTRSMGRELAMTLVLDSMRTLHADPNVLAGRDEILAEVDDLHRAGRLTASEHAETKAAVWASFAKFGMGVAARSDGSEIFGTVADHGLPESSSRNLN